MYLSSVIIEGATLTGEMLVNKRRKTSSNTQTKPLYFNSMKLIIHTVIVVCVIIVRYIKMSLVTLLQALAVLLRYVVVCL